MDHAPELPDPDLITTQASFVAFLGDLERAVREEPGGPHGSTNVDLPAFLEAMAGWLGDAHQGWIPGDLNWAFFARLLMAGHTYE